MTYRTIGSLTAAICLTALASAAQKPSKQRLDQIWDAVDNRMAQQIDVWFDDGDFPKAINGLTFQSTYSPHDYDVVTNLGWMQENVEDWSGALATYRLYKKNNPQDKDAALPEAQLYFGRKEYAKVPALLEPTLSRHPHPNVYRILAHSYERMNKWKDSLRIWKQYVAVAPGDGQAKVNLAKAERKVKAQNPQ